MKKRSAKVTRSTTETRIELELVVDGSGQSEIQTGIGFFDHMLTLFARHGCFDLQVRAEGDLEVDFHHTVEDVGICLGQAFAQALGDKKGLVRYGSFYLPMDEALCRVVIDFGGRPYLVFDAPEKPEAIAGFPFQLVEEFLRGFAVQAGVNLHVALLYGRDSHHMAEAVFKGLARAADLATTLDPRVQGVPSTKGTL